MSSSTVSPSVQVRPAAAQDSARLADLSAQLGYPASRERISERLAKVLSNAGGAAFVGEIEGAVAGWIEIHERPPLLVDGDSEAEIMGLVVDVQFRLSGLGRKLVVEAERWARGRGCRSMRVRTNVIRQDAHAFYERTGFSKLKTQSVYKKSLTENPAGDARVLPTKEGYDRWAEVYDVDGNPLTTLEEPIVRELLGDVRKLRVADIGCGTGRHLPFLLGQGAEVSAVDFSEGMLDKARTRIGSEKAAFIQHDVTTPLPFKDQEFDLVLSCLVLEHITDLDSFFRELARVCRAGGFVVVSAMHPAMWLKGQSARFLDPTTGEQIRPRSYPQQLSDYVMASRRAGLIVEHMSEHAPDEELAKKFPRARKHVGWPMLVAMRLRRERLPE